MKENYFIAEHQRHRTRTLYKNINKIISNYKSLKLQIRNNHDQLNPHLLQKNSVNL